MTHRGEKHENISTRSHFQSGYQGERISIEDVNELGVICSDEGEMAKEGEGTRGAGEREVEGEELYVEEM